MEDIRDTAIALVKFIEKTDVRNRPICLKEFPSGACGDYSLILHTYLFRLGVPSLYVRASDLDEQSNLTHCWVEVDGVIVDATIIQFDQSAPAVFIGQDSPWHRRFKIDERTNSTVYDYVGPTMPELVNYYEAFEQFIAVYK